MAAARRFPDVPSAREVLALADEFGTSVDFLAGCAGARVEDLVRQRDGADGAALERAKVAPVAALLRAMRAGGVEPVPWLEGLLVAGVPVRRKALLGMPEVLEGVREGSLSPEEALDARVPGWREAYGVPAVTARRPSRAKGR